MHLPGFFTWESQGSAKFLVLWIQSNSWFSTFPSLNLLDWINSQSLEDTQVGYTSQKYTLEKYMYIFLKSIAAIIHFWAFIPPYTQEAFRPPYTPRSIYAFLQPQISVCIPLPPSVDIFEEHCCHHSFPRIAASIQLSPRSIQASIHPWLISPHHCLKGHKSLRTFCNVSETLTEWKSGSVTYGRTYLHLTWEGARDTCVSKNIARCTMDWEYCDSLPWSISTACFHFSC